MSSHAPPLYEPEPTLPPSKPKNSRVFPRDAYDSDLIRAKKRKEAVGLILSVQTDYTDEVGFCKALVIHVDPYNVKFQVGSKFVWIRKSHIVSVEIPK